jgi:hypothetical protein
VHEDGGFGAAGLAEAEVRDDVVAHCGVAVAVMAITRTPGKAVVSARPRRM